MVFNRVFRLLVFATRFVNYCPSNLLPGSVCDWEGVGGVSCVGDHILQDVNTRFLTTFRTNKIATPPQTKN
jgi:hypothetical protein